MTATTLKTELADRLAAMRRDSTFIQGIEFRSGYKTAIEEIERWMVQEGWK